MEIVLEKYFENGDIILITEELDGYRYMGTGQSAFDNINLINDYNCTDIFFSSFANAQIDLSKLINISKINSLEICCFVGVTLDFDKEILSRFSGLDNIHISGPIPSCFPDFTCFKMLRQLRIADSKSNRTWLNCSQLERLSIERFTGSDLSEFYQLSNLKSLILIYGKLKNLYGINILQNLQEIRMYNQRYLINANQLCDLEKLETLWVENAKKITDWRFLVKSKSIKNLNLPTVEAIDFVKEMPQLKHFYYKKLLKA